VAAARVFITHEISIDYTPAQTYGDLIPVTSQDVSNVAGSEINRNLVRRIAKVLGRFNPEADFLLVSGSPYVGAMCAWVLGTLGVQKFKMLRWSNQDRKYSVVEVG
jgi:hypothetical protein